MSAFRNSTSWYLGLSAYWFANSAKYFILLLLVLPKQVEELTPAGTENTQWGQVALVGALWGIFGPAIFGYLSDRIGRKRAPFVSIGAGLTVISLMVLGSAQELWVLYVGYLMLAVSDDVGQGAYQALIPEHVPEERRGRASGIMAALELLAQIFIAVLGLALGLDVRLIYISLALINIICAAITVITIRGAKPLVEVQSLPASANIFKGWLRPWSHIDFRWVWLTRFLLSLGFYMVQLYVRNYLDDRVPVHTLFGLNVPADFAVLVVGLTISLSGALGALWSAKVVDQVGRKAVTRWAGIGMSILLIPFAFIPNYTVIFVLAVLFGIGYGAHLSSSWALASDILPDAQSLATDMGVWAMSLTVGQMLAGFAGRLIDMGNRYSMGAGYTGAFLLGACFFFASSLFIGKVQGSR